MTKTLTIRLPATLMQQLKAKAKSAKTNPTAVLRRMAAEYVHEGKPATNSMQEHIRTHAGTWDGNCSGEKLLRRTRR
jgi:hypothetical protein